MPANRNILYLLIGALIVAVGVLGYNLYQTKKATGRPADQCRSERVEDTKQVKHTLPPVMISRIGLFSMLLLGSLVLWPLRSSALEGQVSREQDIVNLQLGQRIKVDDGSCPAGQIKEISGAKMTPTGIARGYKCIPRIKK